MNEKLLAQSLKVKIYLLGEIDHLNSATTEAEGLKQICAITEINSRVHYILYIATDRNS